LIDIGLTGKENTVKVYFMSSSNESSQDNNQMFYTVLYE